MCFYNDDVDWVASVYEDNRDVKPDTAARCYECRSPIRPGEPRRHVFMQEHEGCIKCDRDARDKHQDQTGDYDETDESDSPLPLTTCPEGEHDYGEEFECDICQQCQKLLDAIMEVEIAEGCHPNDSQPLFGHLCETFSEADSAEDYINHARNKFPELAMSGHLDKFYGRTREWQDEFEGDEWYGDVVKGADGELGGEGG